jgi:hypothetical protein
LWLSVYQRWGRKTKFFSGGVKIRDRRNHGGGRGIWDNADDTVSGFSSLPLIFPSSWKGTLYRVGITPLPR